jgi:hypothetical protein
MRCRAVCISRRPAGFIISTCGVSSLATRMTTEISCQDIDAVDGLTCIRMVCIVGKPLAERLVVGRTEQWDHTMHPRSLAALNAASRRRSDPAQPLPRVPIVDHRLRGRSRIHLSASLRHALWRPATLTRCNHCPTSHAQDRRNRRCHCVRVSERPSPPHVHARFQGVAVRVRITDAELLDQAATFPARVLRDVRSWLLQDRDRAAEVWAAYHE